MTTMNTATMRSFFAFLSAVVLLVCSAGSALGAEKLTDPEITNAVDDELIEDTATPADYVDVTTDDGVVTLTGSVSNILAKDRAERIAAMVKGVRAIINSIEVNAPFRTGIAIEEGVEEVLETNSATESWEIDASVDDAVVTLNGSVDSWQEKELAATVAKGVSGVEVVRNDLTVAYDAERPGAEIKNEIEASLYWDAYIDDALIEVSVDDGEVTLDGTVGSLAEKSRAYNKAWVAGVESVDNDDLDVKWWSREEQLRKEKYISKSDDEIRDAVTDAFIYDPRVISTNVAVEAKEGTVTLRGTVDSLQAKRRAAEDARNVVGVWSVDNKLKVRTDRPSDATIESNVVDAFERHPALEKYQTTVSVTDGEVYLYGDVDSTFEKSQADEVASRQQGVQAVHNFLAVNAPTGPRYGPYTGDPYWYDYDWYEGTTQKATISDWEIYKSVRDELFWSPFVDADEVDVEVSDGVATLTGTVETYREREAARENALEGGAFAVKNKLAVEYGPDFYKP